MEVRARVASLAVALTILAGACGDGSSTSSPPRTTTTTTTSTTTTSTTTSTTTTPPTTAAPTTAPPTAPPATAPPPPISGVAIVIRRGDPARRVVALTFDAGSDVGYTDAILDTLHAAGIRATFSLTGQWTAANPAAARRIVAEGHQLMNHTQSHPSFTGASTGKGPLPTAQRVAELQAANSTIVAVTGVDTRPWFRPPYGDTDVSVQRDVAGAGYGYEVMWTLDSLGWNGLPADQITARCLNAAQPGAIYLFHVGSASQDSTALAAIIAGLGAAGYGFVTVAQMVSGG